jgi:transcriptional regulator with XRE-family HTH domain
MNFRFIIGFVFLIFPYDNKKEPPLSVFHKYINKEVRMEIDYKEIGRRIARRRKELKLTQFEVEEQADLGQKYLSNIERSISIPSIEVIMRLAAALDTTPDEFLVGTLHEDTKDEWENISELLRNMSPAQLSMAKSFLTWLSDQKL